MRVPITNSEPFFINARLLGLYADVTDHRRQDDFIVSALRGIDFPVVQSGIFSVLVEQQFLSQGLPATNVYASFALEAWP